MRVEEGASARWKDSRLLHYDTANPPRHPTVPGRDDPPPEGALPTGNAARLLCGGGSCTRKRWMPADHGQTDRVRRPSRSGAGRCITVIKSTRPRTHKPGGDFSYTVHVQALLYIHRRHPSSMLVAVSEGSGSGVLLSYLGESGSSSYLTAAAAISPVLLGQLWFETNMPPIYRCGVLLPQKLQLSR